ncbi:hypothetical protein EXS57_01505 [Candidatus Kaiserbacteria bacterium]|nr:hypothetical protein [Candidatus Kaiserbacteria bacterium]
MPTIVLFLVFCQALGALIGALTAVWSEIAYMRAMRDKKIDTAERTHLDIIARGLRFGMTLLLLSSFGLVVVNYQLHAPLQPALSPSYWTSILLALTIIGFAWALSRRHLSFAFGSAVIFTAWWFLFFLTTGQLPALSFGAAVSLLAVTTTLFYALLEYSRFLILRT